MSNNTKEKIYREAFKLFMSKPYESVTIRDIENAIGMTRGAIFYYVKDKEELFREVIEKFYVKNQSLTSKIEIEELKPDMSLKEFIDVYIKGIEKAIKKIYEFAGIAKTNTGREELARIDRFYLSIALITDFYLKDFHKKIEEILTEEKNSWNFFIQRAIASGEVKPGTNAKLYSELFSSLYLGITFNDAFYGGIDTQHLKELFLMLYNQIKV
jgi:AcrR family transcriptional regulator